MLIKKVFLLLLIVSSSITYGQKADTTTVNALLDESKSLIGSDSAKAISLAQKARKMAEEIDFPKGEAYALKNMGMVYYLKGKYEETLNYWNQSLQVFEKAEDNVGIANMLSNIGAVYFNQGADAKALEYNLKSLQLAEKINDTLRMISALSNVGSIYYNKKDPLALNYLLKVLPLVENIGNTDAYVVTTGNIGEIYYDNNNDQKALEYYQRSIKAADDKLSAAFAVNGIGKVYLKEGQLDKALQSHQKALSIARKFDDKLQEVRSLRGIAAVYMKKGIVATAIDYLQQAHVVVEQMDDVKIEMKDLYQDMALAYANGNDYPNAFHFKSLYADLKDTLYNIESKKKLNQLQFDFELAKKEGEINLKEANIQSEKQARIGVTIGLGLLLIIAFILFRNYLQKSKINDILDKKNNQIEHLLLNILPKEIATELQNNGVAKPRHYDEVTVLFSDFKNFTTIADKLSPEEVVEELNHCFRGFDDIIEKYELEKIKTIGDAYMCAGNIPSSNDDHSYKMIKAALEMQSFIDQLNIKRADKGMTAWEIRIGVHIGPLVAGVVGKKKYAYDIWGSTVNIASRMESNGIPGKVNISAHMYTIIKDRFECSHRGKIYAKNLGELDMYLVEREKPSATVHVIHSVVNEEQMHNQQ